MLRLGYEARTPRTLSVLKLLPILVAGAIGIGSCGSLTGVPDGRSRDLSVDAFTIGDLRRGDEVRIGSVVQGSVRQLTRIELLTGARAWRIKLVLHQSAGRLPLDSSAKVCRASVRGGAYLQLRRGQAPRMIPDGGTMSVSRTSTPRVC